MTFKNLKRGPKLRMWLALAGLCAGLGYGPARAVEVCDKLVVTGNPEYPPFLWRDAQDDSRLVGANADLVQLLAKEIGIPVEVRYVGSWARVQELARAGKVDMIAGAFYTLPRLEYMDYFYPAIHETRSVVWTAPGSTLRYRKWSDLKGLRGVTVINNSFGDEFDRFAKDNLNISAVPSLENALSVLQKGRADYLLYEEDPGQAYIARMGLTGLKPEAAAISNEDLYVTLSHKSVCNTGEIRGRIAKAIYILEKQGFMQKLVESNIQVWRRQGPATKLN